MAAPSSSTKSTSSVHDIADDKPAFGSRFLTDSDDVWSQNAWDHVSPPTDQAERIQESLERQRKGRIAAEETRRYHEKPSRNWDEFYKSNEANFFKDRKWLHNEFPELVAAAQSDAGQKTIVELGCGAGNSIFPVLTSNQNPDLRLHAFDYASHAVKLVQRNPLYTSPPLGTINSAVWDLSSSSLPPGIEPGSVDLVVMVFVLSALHPDEWAQALKNVHTMLKPGGKVLFRDYGRHDLTQLRFKAGRLLDVENFYIRGDKTRVYFFELDELALLFTGSHATKEQTSVVESVERDPAEVGDGLADTTMHTPGPGTPSLESPNPSSTPAPPSLSPEPSNTITSHLTRFPSGQFTVDSIGVDRRLIVNRKRQIKMYRVWMQGKFIRV
ncbi:S-adenosyl-L-methionine-dependent methyltransferase [Pterulicium gracile]|uniref:tRNA N(3)-methylcytidine methyltransferase n=1 Tax=Pterulicium gracile TaxID=1884261 RepID=A0A5C3QVA6_9AGAR|nr:S-adenosyl-L-methionine-dependent methyltransferase [Pterula gracilis]